MSSPEAPSQTSSVDAVDRHRIRIARTSLAAVASAALWAALGIEWAEAWCRQTACQGDVASLGLTVAWAAAAAFVAGRAAWSWHRGTWIAGLAFLSWTAWCVVFPAASGLLLAGPMLRWSLAGGQAVGFLLHGALLGALHVGGAWLVERGALRGPRRAAPAS